MVTVTTRDGVGISTKYKDWGDGQPIVFHHSCRRAQMARETASVQMAEGSKRQGLSGKCSSPHAVADLDKYQKRIRRIALGNRRHLQCAVSDFGEPW